MLTERGDPRGEFITLQLARARGPVTPPQLTRERELAAVEEHRIAWGRPVSKGGTCHLSRGFPDELMIEPKQFDGLVGHPALSTLHTVTAFNFGVSEKSARAFLLHPSTARLRSVSELTREMVECLDAPLPWPSVGLAFPPTRDHRDHLAQVPELKINMQLQPLTAECFRGLTALTKLKVGHVAEGTFEPLTGLERLEVSDWRSPHEWGKELASLPRLAHLKLGATISAIRLKGLRLKSLECWTSSELDIDALLGGFPQLEELRLWCATEAATKQTLEKLMAAERLSQLRFVSAGIFDLTAPRTPTASLEVRAWRDSTLTKYVPSIEVLPAGLAPKLVVRPHSPDPWAIAGAPPKGLEELRAAAKMPVELAWY